jgi:ribosomal-protein-serine acetyltransferase
MTSPQQLYPLTLAGDITLKPLQAADSAKFFDFVAANRADLERFDPFVTAFQTPADARKTLAEIESLTSRGLSLTCGIWDNLTCIGWVNGGLDFEHKTVKIGYGLAGSHQGQGIISQAVQAIIDHAFTQLGITSAYLITRDDNTKSVKVAERLGFKRSGEGLPPLPGQAAGIVRHRYVLERTI